MGEGDPVIVYLGGPINSCTDEEANGDVRYGSVVDAIKERFPF